jgi:hypothetical protein
MPTDEIRDAFHRTFEPTVSDVTADQALLTVVRRRHARQQRLSAVGVSLGVVAVTTGALVGSVAGYGGDAGAGDGDGDGTARVADSAGTTSSAPTGTLQTVSLVGHDLALPSDWKLSGNRELIDLDTIEPQQPVGGKDQSVTATSPDGTQQFEATVYSGAIAEIYRDINSAEDLPTFDRFVINGLEASFKISGAPKTCRMFDGSEDGQTPTSLADAQQHSTEVPCPQSVSDNAPYGEVRYTFANGDFMSVDTRGMDAEVLTTFLVTALSD